MFGIQNAVLSTVQKVVDDSHKEGVVGMNIIQRYNPDFVKQQKFLNYMLPSRLEDGSLHFTELEFSVMRMQNFVNTCRTDSSMKRRAVVLRWLRV